MRKQTPVETVTAAQNSDSRPVTAARRQQTRADLNLSEGVGLSFSEAAVRSSPRQGRGRRKSSRKSNWTGLVEPFLLPADSELPSHLRPPLRHYANTPLFGSSTRVSFAGGGIAKSSSDPKGPLFKLDLQKQGRNY